jgi:hypothetical protein
MSPTGRAKRPTGTRGFRACSYGSGSGVEGALGSRQSPRIVIQSLPQLPVSPDGMRDSLFREGVKGSGPEAESASQRGDARMPGGIPKVSET